MENFKKNIFMIVTSEDKIRSMSWEEDSLKV